MAGVNTPRCGTAIEQVTWLVCSAARAREPGVPAPTFASLCGKLERKCRRHEEHQQHHDHSVMIEESVSVF
jgi:hypothetical protein